LGARLYGLFGHSPLSRRSALAARRGGRRPRRRILATASSADHSSTRLVGQGLTNRQIAAGLYISERTAQNHVQHILTKLGFANRSQIAVWSSAQPAPPAE
jgi:DNA-binding NarL/FixJ family response regulator